MDVRSPAFRKTHEFHPPWPCPSGNEPRGIRTWRCLMSGIWISAATIARFAVAGSLMALMAAGQSAPKAASTIVEQTWYVALPGKAQEVYRLRLHACDVLEKLGLPRGHVLRRQGNSETLPDPRRNATCTNPRDSCRREAP